MSKKAKRLLVLGVFVAVLLAIYAVVFTAGKKREAKEAAEAEEEENGFLIGEMDEDEIVGFSFQHVGDENYDENVYVFSKQGDTWYYKDDLNFPVEQDVIALRVEDLAKVYAKRLLEDTDENFAAYGLDNPKLILSVTDGKETITYNIGNYNESTADYYLNIEGTTEVYTVEPTLWVGFSMELYDVVEEETFPEIQSDHITKLVIENGTDTLTFDFEITGTEEDDSTNTVTNVGDWYIIDSDGERVRANNSKTESLVSAIVDTSFTQEVNYDCADDQLSQYGLDNPSVTITIDYTVDKVDLSSVEKEQVSDNVSEITYDTTEQQYTLVMTIGNTTDTFSYTDDYYVKLSQNAAILTLDAESAEMYADLTRDNFVSVQKINLETESADE